MVNEVRTRAGLAGLANVTVDDVLTERRLEFVGEGKRYFDLVRAEGISGASASNKATTALVPDEYGYRTNSWTAKKEIHSYCTRRVGFRSGFGSECL